MSNFLGYDISEAKKLAKYLNKKICGSLEEIQEKIKNGELKLKGEFVMGIRNE